MLTKTGILNNGQAIMLLLVFAAGIQRTHAQVNDSLLAGTPVQSNTIKQLVIAHLSRQLQSYGTFGDPAQTGLQKLLNDPIAIDSICTMLVEKIQEAKKLVASTGTAAATGIVNVSTQVLNQQFAKLVQATEIKTFISQFTGILQKPGLEWKDGTVSATGQSVASIDGNGSVLAGNTILTSSWAAMGIPVEVQLFRQDLSGPGCYVHQAVSVRFNREAYLQSIRSSMQLTWKAGDLLPYYTAAWQQLKQSAVTKLTTSLGSLDLPYKEILSKQLETMSDAANLLQSSNNPLQENILAAGVLQQLNETVAKSGYDSATQVVQLSTGMNRMKNILRSFTAQVQQTGLLQKLQYAKQQGDEMQQALNEPGSLASMAGDQLGLNGLQKLFLHINQMAIGMNSITLSPLTVSQYINNGFNATFNKGKNFLFVMMGRQQAISSIFDNRLTTLSFAPSQTVMGIRVGKGLLTENHTHLSVFTFSEKKFGSGAVVSGVAPGSTVLATISQQLNLDESNVVHLEVSAASHAYNNWQNSFDGVQQRVEGSKQTTGGLFQQMAVSLQWTGRIKQNDLSYDLHGSSTGRAYSNPGNIFISPAETEWGGSLRTRLFQHRLQLTARGNYRAYGFGAGDTKWHNYNYTLQAKWKLPGNQSVSFSYQPYELAQLHAGTKISQESSTRWCADGNFRKRFHRYSYQHTVSVAVIKNNYSASRIASGNSILVASMQTISIQARSYYLATQYNSNGMPSLLYSFNTQFNVDAGFAYTIGGGITGSSAINYNSAAGWCKQVGIRQTISGRIGERFAMTLYADIVKTVKQTRPVNMGSRFNWNLQYAFK